MFKAIGNKGFHVQFENGYVLSVQWGTVNYCEARDYNAAYGCEASEPKWSSEDAEVAIMDSCLPDMPFVTREFIPTLCDDVKGWVTADEVATLMLAVASKKRQPSKK